MPAGALKPGQKLRKEHAMPRKTTRKTTTKKRKTTTSGGNKPRTKTEILGNIADTTGLSRKEVSGVFDAMSSMIKKDLSSRGPGSFTVPGLLKIKKVHKPHRPARPGINPFTGEQTTFKAKPAHNVVKARALKSLKDMV